MSDLDPRSRQAGLDPDEVIERAAIMEFDGKMERSVAEEKALQDIASLHGVELTTLEEL